MNSFTPRKPSKSDLLLYRILNAGCAVGFAFIGGAALALAIHCFHQSYTDEVDGANLFWGALCFLTPVSVLFTMIAWTFAKWSIEGEQ